jgi:DNA-binding response OmpR family regulator
VSQRPWILLVEDDRDLGEGLRDALEIEGYRVRQAMDGRAGLKDALSGEFALVILDVMLPRLSGFDVLKEMRRRRPGQPVIMLTARGEEIDKVRGLTGGADDYVTKPFSPRELVARVKAILRRADGPARSTPTVIAVGEVEVDTGRREARLRGEPVALAAREFDLLQYLCENQGLALSRRQLLDGVWGTDWVGDDRTVDVHVRQLRKKLGDALPLDTVWGVGYRLG